MKKVYGAYTDDGLPFLIGEAELEAYGPDILTPPHLVKLPPPPEPEPPTEEELERLEWFCDVARAAGDAMDVTWEMRQVVAEVPRLITELRRLRAEWWKDHLMG